MSMSTEPIGLDTQSARSGAIALVLGVLFLAATVFAFVLSLSDSFNPPNWVRVLGLVWIPIGLFGTPVAYALARRGPGSQLGALGLAIAAVGLLAFVVLLIIAG
jgi:hypothetical protein